MKKKKKPRSTSPKRRSTKARAVKSSRMRSPRDSSRHTSRHRRALSGSSGELAAAITNSETQDDGHSTVVASSKSGECVSVTVSNDEVPMSLKRSSKRRRRGGDKNHRGRSPERLPSSSSSSFSSSVGEKTASSAEPKIDSSSSDTLAAPQAKRGRSRSRSRSGYYRSRKKRQPMWRRGQLSLADLVPDITLCDLYAKQVNVFSGNDDGGDEESSNGAFDKLEMGEELGRGAFGSVVCATLTRARGRVSEAVAAKQLELAESNEAQTLDAFGDFLRELTLMASLECPSIIGVQGFALHPSPVMLLELAPGGDLHRLLHDPFALLEPMDALCNAVGAKLIERDRARSQATEAEPFDEERWAFASTLSAEVARLDVLRQREDLDEAVRAAVGGLIESSASFWIEPTADRARRRDLALRIAIGEYEKLLHQRSHALDSRLMLRIVLDVARALRYLHTRSPPIAHLDIKCSNIILTRALSATACLDDLDDLDERAPLAKLADFGLSTRITPSEHDGDDLRGCPEPLLNTNPRWAPPEVLDAGHMSVCSDVYGFSLVLWECITREMPFSDFQGAVSEGPLRAAICRGQRPSIPSSCPQPLSSLIEDCWHPLPSQRPTAAQIVQRLEQYL